MRDVLVISGPCGAGKSSVGFECLELLEQHGLAAAMVDAELAYFQPKPPDDPQGTAVAEAALAAVVPIYSNAGIDRLLLPRVVELPRHLELVRTAVREASLQVAWLEVSSATLVERLTGREVGSALEWHIRRAEEIRRHSSRYELFDFSIDGERPVADVASDLLTRAGWLAAEV